MDGNWSDYQTHYNTFRDAMEKKYGDMTKDRQKVGMAVKKALDDHLDSLGNQVDLYTIKGMTDEAHATYGNEFNDTVHEMANIADPIKRAQKRAEFEAKGEVLKGKHLLESDFVAKHLEKLDEEVEKADIYEKIKSDNLEDLNGIWERLKMRKQTGEFSHVNVDFLAQMQVFAKDRIDTLGEKGKKEAREKKQDDVASVLNDMFGENDDEKLIRLRSPDFRKEYKLDIQDTDTPTRFFDTQKKITHDVKASNDEKVRLEINKKLIDGKNPDGTPYTIADQKKDFHRFQLPQDEDRFRKIIEKNEALKDTFSEWRSIKDMIDKGEDRDKIETVLAETNLTVSTKKKLYSEIGQAVAPIIKEGLKRGDEYLRSQLAPKKSDILPPAPEDEERALNAQIALSDWVREQNILVVDGKRKSLTAKEITEYAHEIMPHFSVPFSQRAQEVKLREDTNYRSGQDPAFVPWLSKLEEERGKQGKDYDLEDWFKHATPKQRQEILDNKDMHFEDTYKMPTHLTFSTESKHSSPTAPGGVWHQISKGHWSFTPSWFNLSQHSRDEYTKEFAGDYGLERDDKGKPTGGRVELILPKGEKLTDKAAWGIFLAAGRDKKKAIQMTKEMGYSTAP
jgi:hypothetical protein